MNKQNANFCIYALDPKQSGKFRKVQTMKRGLISSSLLLAFCASTVAGAQQASTPATDSNTTTPRLTNTETIVVTAPGEFRMEQELLPATLLEETAGTSPIKALAQLPSVNFQAADPFGSYEWAVRISVRGFNQSQLGFTLDDIPLGDMSYGNWNGLHISRAIIDENIGRIVMSQGTGALGTASNSNLGGTVQFYSADPLDKRGFQAAQSFGSYNSYRTYARFDSGLLGGNTKFYISGAYNLTDKWRGHGDVGQNYWQLNGKLVRNIGARSQLSVFADISNRHEVDYQDVNKVWVNKLGYNWDNYGIWNNAVQAAYACAVDYGFATGYNYPYPVSGLNRSTDDTCDAGYYGGAGLRKDVLAGATFKTALSDSITWKTTIYGHGNDGAGLWFMPSAEMGSSALYSYVLAATGSPILMRTSEYGIKRGGIITSVSYEKDNNKLEGGFWYEKEDFTLARRFYTTAANSAVHSLYSMPSNPFYTQWSYDFNSNVYHFHIQDVYRFNDKLSAEAGFKSVYSDLDGKLGTFDSPLLLGSAASSFAQGSRNAGKPFLPQLGLNYKLDTKNELFADAAYNVRTYQAGAHGYGSSPWNTNQAGFDAVKDTLKPETSWTEEVGYRFTDKNVSAQASYFHVNFYDRLLAFSQGSAIAGGASLLGNAGGVTTNGIDTSISVHLGPQWTLYNALTWNRSTYDDNVQYYSSSAGAFATYYTQGKLNVDSPEVLYKNSLDYKNAGFFGHIGSDYMSTRYFTYSNDGSVAGRFLTEMNLGYGREQLGAFKELKAQLNVTNLLNSQYWSTVGTNGFVYSDPQSVNNNTLQVGAPRTISATISVQF